MATSAQSAQILVIDDQEPNVQLLASLLKRAGYQAVVTHTDPRDVVSMCIRLQPDLLILDLMMPYLDGFGVMEQLRPWMAGQGYFPILVLTADISLAVKQRALALGARDFVSKPFDTTEVLLRIHNLLETRCLHLRLRDQNQHLEEQVRARTHALDAAQVEILERLAQAAECRDDATGQHTRRVGHLSAQLGAGLGMPTLQVDLLRHAAPLHDVGKIAIPDHILRKPGPLTADERAVMQTHTTLGAQLLAGGQSDLVRLAESVALTHHEHWDGAGYPQGLAGTAIPLAGRIVAVIDVFDALTHVRPYKAAWPVDAALGEIEDQAGRQFDPQVVAAFRQVAVDTDRGARPLAQVLNAVWSGAVLAE